MTDAAAQRERTLAARFAGAAILVLSVAAAAIAIDRVPAASPPPRVEAALRIDINRASIEELSLLPGIGDALASRIVRDRERRGPFPTVHSLVRVRGIGERTILRIEPYTEAVVPPAQPR